MYKLKVDSFRFLVQVLFCLILTFQAFAWDASFLSTPVITRSHRRLKGSTFKSFPSLSMVICVLHCQRHTRCVSATFRKAYSLYEPVTGGVCELNESLIDETQELEYEEESVYTQFLYTKVSYIIGECNVYSSIFLCVPDSFFFFSYLEVRIVKGRIA